VNVRQVPVALRDVEAVTDEELVRDREADVANREILDEAAVRPVEQCDDGERGRLAEPERLAQVVQRQARVDHVLDDQDVAVRDLRVQVLQEPDPRVAARVGVGAVARKLDEIDPVRNRDRTRQIGEEDGARLQRGDEQWLTPVVVTGDLAAELGDARGQLLPREVDLADGLPRLYDASSRRYR
jgi:hypothetical protein